MTSTTYTFTGTNGSVPSGVTVRGSANADIQDNELSLIRSGTGGAWAGVIYTDPAQSTDVDITFQQRQADSGSFSDCTANICDDEGALNSSVYTNITPNTAYVLAYRHWDDGDGIDNVFLHKIVSGSASQLAVGSRVLIAVGATAFIRIIRGAVLGGTDANQIRVFIWEDGDPAPDPTTDTPNIDHTDSTNPLAAGRESTYAIRASGSPDERYENVTIDDFVAGGNPVPLDGVGDSVFDGSGDLSISRGLDGVGDLVFDGSGELSVGAEVLLHGEGETVFTGEGALSLAQALAGTGDLALDGSGDLTAALTLAGTGDLVFAGVGQLTTQGEVVIAAIRASLSGPATKPRPTSSPGTARALTGPAT